MKEELKQAIGGQCEKWILNCPIENTDEDNFNQISSIVLSTPSILRHADPQIMKQAGWVREEDLMQDLMNRTFDKIKTKTYPQEVESIINKLNNKP